MFLFLFLYNCYKTVLKHFTTGFIKFWTYLADLVFLASCVRVCLVILNILKSFTNFNSKNHLNNYFKCFTTVSLSFHGQYFLLSELTISLNQK